MLLKTSAYIKGYDGQIEWMYFLIEDGDLLEKSNTIWDKISADIKRESDREPVCNKELLKTKVKSHGDEVTGLFYKKILKVDDSNQTYLAVICLDSSVKEGSNYYPQVFLKRV